jgi:hypothetical protein
MQMPPPEKKLRNKNYQEQIKNEKAIEEKKKQE